MGIGEESVEMSEDALERKLDSSFKSGVSQGLEQASALLMKKATEKFEMHKDTEATLLREMAGDVLKMKES